MNKRKTTNGYKEQMKRLSEHNDVYFYRGQSEDHRARKCDTNEV